MERVEFSSKCFVKALAALIPEVRVIKPYKAKLPMQNKRFSDSEGVSILIYCFVPVKCFRYIYSRVKRIPYSFVV